MLSFHNHQHGIKGSVWHIAYACTVCAAFITCIFSTKYATNGAIMYFQTIQLQGTDCIFFNVFIVHKAEMMAQCCSFLP